MPAHAARALDPLGIAFFLSCLELTIRKLPFGEG